MFGPSELGMPPINPGTEAPATTLFTVYLDNNAPPENSRALNLQLAQMGYDFFEVVFLAPNGVVARTSWERGQTAGVSGVQRGIDYAQTNPDNVGGTNGAAVMFVGKKQDKTLLAIGKLVYVDDTTNTTVISADTKSVTFGLSALTAGVAHDPQNSSFLTGPGPGPSTATATAANTVIGSEYIGPLQFPWYILKTNESSLVGTYTFELHTAASAVPDPLANYVTAIRMAGPITFDKTLPWYTANDGTPYNLQNSIDYDDVTVVTVLNSYTIGAQFQNPIIFGFNTTNTVEGTLFALVFSVPVYALSYAAGGDSPIIWYVRPGFGEYAEELDTGSGSGGAILIGAAQTPEEHQTSGEYALVVTKNPTKNPYDDSTDMILDLAGLEHVLQRGTESVVISSTVVTYTINGDIVVSGTTDLSTLGLSGYVQVVVTYEATTDNIPDGWEDALGASGTATYTTSFRIYVGDMAQVLFRLVGDNNTEFWPTLTALSTAADGTIMVLVLMNAALDIPGAQMAGLNKTLVIVAGVRNAILGRGNNGANPFTSTAAATVAYYFGRWDIEGGLQLSVPVRTFPYTLNPSGSVDDLTQDVGTPLFATYQGNAADIRVDIDLTKVTLAGNPARFYER